VLREPAVWHTWLVGAAAHVPPQQPQTRLGQLEPLLRLLTHRLRQRRATIKACATQCFGLGVVARTHQSERLIRPESSEEIPILCFCKPCRKPRLYGLRISGRGSTIVLAAGGTDKHTICRSFCRLGYSSSCLALGCCSACRSVVVDDTWRSFHGRCSSFRVVFGGLFYACNLYVGLAFPFAVVAPHAGEIVQTHTSRHVRRTRIPPCCLYMWKEVYSRSRSLYRYFFVTRLERAFARSF
jgi:hypothetical protein